MKKILFIFLALGMASASQAAPLPTAQLSSIVPQNQAANLPLPASATGTISGTTFAFTNPLNGVPEFFTGTWANGSYWNGPLLFTPDTSDPNNPGFTLTGDFHSYWQTYNEIVLGFFSVTAPTGMLIDSISVSITNPTQGTNAQTWQFYAANNSCYAFQSAPSNTCAITPTAFLWNDIDLRFWNPDGGPTVGYDAASFHWHEISAVSVVPEPGIYAMLLAGLGLFGFIVSRRKNQNSMLVFA